MRILRLSLRNLASLAGTHTIDFERDPLRSTGLFSISGATGAGKSTLLDALCLALYESTPRLEVASGTKLPDVGDAQITQRDPANLLRRGEAEGFAEVAFVGVDGQPYTSRWSIRRARQRHDGALQATEMVLYRGNVRDGQGEVACGGKKSEVLPAIAAKVGLSFAQFTRAVLLAQNDFAVFLKSDDRERAEILQALTGTERFERISRAVFERHKAETEAVQALRAKAEGQLPLGPEARAAADAELRQATDALGEFRRQIALRQAHAAWFLRARELAAAAGAERSRLGLARQAQAEAEPRRSALAEAESVVRGARSLHDEERSALAQQTAAEKTVASAQDEIAKAEQGLAAARAHHATAGRNATAAQQALADAAIPLQQARTLDAQLAPAAERLAEKARDRQAADATVTRHRDRTTTLSTEVTALERRLAQAGERRQKLAGLAPVLPEAAGWSERLKASLQAAAEVGERDRDAAAKRTADAGARQRLEAARKRLQQHTQTCAGLEQARAAAEAAARAFDAEALAAGRRSLEARAGVLTELQRALEAADQLGRRRADTEAALTAAREGGAALARELADVERRLPSAEAAWNAKRDSRALAEATVEKHTLVLRERLRAEAPCPVCGSRDHPYAAHAPVVDAALLALREDEARQEAAVLALREEKTRVATKQAANAELVGLKTRELATLRDEFDAAQPRIELLLGKAGLAPVSAGDRRAAVQAAADETVRARQELETREASQRQAAKSLDDAQRLWEQARRALGEAQQAGAAEETKAARATAELRSAEEAQARAVKIRGDADAALAGLFALLPAGAAARFQEAGARFIDEFTRQTTELRRLDEEISTDGRRLDALRLQLEEVRKALVDAEALAKTRADEERAAHAVHEQLRAGRAGLLGGRAAADVERELTTALDRQRTELEAAASRVGEATKAHAVATATAGAARQAAELARQRSAAASAAVEQWLERHAAERNRRLDRDQLTAILGRPLAWLDAEREALAALDLTVNQAQGAVATCTQAVAQHEGSRPTPEDEAAVAAALAAAQAADAAAENRRAAARAVVDADELRRKEHADGLARLAERERQADPWAKLNDLIGSADGAKFRTIVQGRTLDLLLLYANQQLELLSARYRLERLRPSLNLVVIDRDMADERRSVHSLSGGESFLVSLALALGLASLTSNRIRIESLFIDEGFGSLDPATLNTAMNALLHLEAQGRKVGVISHVTEMADAIPVQIKVVKGHGGASRIVVPGADAGTTAEPATRAAAAATDRNPEIVARLLEILERYKRDGEGFVSAVKLRRELGCDPDAFAAARVALGDRVQSEGRSLGLR